MVRLDTLASITNRNDGTEFGGSIYQKVNNKVETSVNLAWTAGSNNTRFGIAAKYQLDEKTSIVVRILLLGTSISSSFKYWKFAVWSSCFK